VKSFEIAVCKTLDFVIKCCEQVLKWGVDCGKVMFGIKSKFKFKSNNLLCKVIFSRQNYLFQNPMENLAGKIITLQMNKVQFKLLSN
jgi:hypothetical protein